MNILLIGNYRFQSQQSMIHFANMLVKKLAEVGIESKILVATPIFGRLKPSETGIGKWLGYIDRFLIFPWVLLLALRHADVIHICDHGNAVYVPFLLNKPNLVTCHDLLGARVACGMVQDRHTGILGRLLARAMLHGLALAGRVACVSKATMDDLFRFVPTRSVKDTIIIENDLNYNYSPMDKSKARSILDELKIPSYPFLLHVGGNQWYKNRAGVLQIFNHLRKDPSFKSHRLVMAGKSLEKSLRVYINENDLDNYVFEHINVSHEALCALYSLAEALIFPSIAEGFGWPIIEAQACGCPVFTSNRGPMMETGGKAAVYFDPSNVETATQIIRTNWAYRDRMSHEGFVNAERFSADKMIKQYVHEYRRLAANDGL